MRADWPLLFVIKFHIPSGSVGFSYRTSASYPEASCCMTLEGEPGNTGCLSSRHCGLTGDTLRIYSRPRAAPSLITPPSPQTQAHSQQTRDVLPMLVYCWASVVDDGPTLNQHWLNVSCLLGIARIPPKNVKSFPQQTRDVETMLFKCCVSVVDCGHTLNNIGLMNCFC